MRARSTILIFVVIAVFVALLALLSFCLSCHVKRGDRVLSEAAETLLRQSEGLCLEARKLNPDDWERMWVIHPYVAPDDLACFPWKVRLSVLRTNIRYQESLCILLFLRADGDYEMFVENRMPVDFVAFGSSGSVYAYSPDDLLCFSEDDDPQFRFYLIETEEQEVDKRRQSDKYE